MRRGRPFQPGNKLGRGRPRGSRNKKTLIAQELLDSHAEPLLRKALVLALKGDQTMLRILLGYVLPRAKDLPANTGTLRMETAEQLGQTFDAIVKKVSTGQLSVSQAQEIAGLIESRRRVIETVEIDSRVRSLEQGFKAFSEPPEP